MEIDKVTEVADTVRSIKAHRMKWLGQIQRIDQARPNQETTRLETMGIRPVGRPRQR